jgi:hypothetical protein
MNRTLFKLGDRSISIVDREDYPKDLCIHQLFEIQVEKTFDAIAVIDRDDGADVNVAIALLREKVLAHLGLVDRDRHSYHRKNSDRDRCLLSLVSCLGFLPEVSYCFYSS